FGLVEDAAEAVGADDHDDPAVAELDDVVLGPAEIAVVGREADVAVLGPRLAAVGADDHAVARVGEGAVERVLVLLVVGADVMLERDQDPAVAGDDVVADEGAVLEAAGDFEGRAPGGEAVIAGEEPGAPGVGPVARMRGEEERGMAAEDHQLGGALAFRRALAREADVEALERSPGLALVGAPGDAGVVQGAWLGVAAGEDEEDPRTVGQLAQG